MTSSPDGRLPRDDSIFSYQWEAIFRAPAAAGRIGSAADFPSRPDGRVCHSAARFNRGRNRDGTRQPVADLQPRQLRAGASASVPGDRAASGRAVQAALGADPLGLADHRQLRFPLPRRLRPRAGRDQAAQRRVHVAETCTSTSRRRWRSAARSSTTPPRCSSPTCSSSTRSRWACAARCAPRWRCSRRAARAASWACATSWTSRRASSTSGSARWCSRRWTASMTRSGSMGCRRSSTRCSEIPGMAALADKLRFTGYLRRTRARDASCPDRSTSCPRAIHPGHAGRRRRRRRAVDWVISAYEHDPGLPHRAVLLLGPFMPAEQRLAFQERVHRDPRLKAITFEAQVEPFFERASAIVGDGRLQHVLRDPVVRQAGPAGAADHAAARAVSARRARAAAGARCACCRNDGAAPRPRAWPRPCASCRQAVAGSASGRAMLQGLDRITALVAPWLAAAQAGCASCAAAAARDRRPPPPRRPGQGLSAPVGDLHRPGDAGPGATRAAACSSSRLRHPTERSRARANRRIPRRSSICRSISTWSRGAWCGACARLLPRRRSGGGHALVGGPPARPDTQSRATVRPGPRACGRAAAEVDWLHVHYLHTPGSVARYTSVLLGLPFSISAHAKDVWTIPDWEKREKIAAARWLVTCSRMNLHHLHALAPTADIELVHHGLKPSGSRHRGERWGRTAAGRRAR